MEIRTRVQTVFILVGPEKCGKTYFAKNKLIPKLKKEYSDDIYKPNIKYLSLMDIQKEILGENINRHNLKSSFLSANKLLLDKLNNFLQFPINPDFVIIDGNGMNHDFRKEVEFICKENHYELEAIVFDFIKETHYKRYNLSDKVQFQINNLKNNIIPNLYKSNLRAIHRLKFIDDFLNININNLKYFYKTLLSNKNTYIAIGDVHECIDELKQLIVKFGYPINNNKIISPENTFFLLMGDFINKGNKTKEIIDFINENLNVFIIIKGNHEELLEKVFKNVLSEDFIQNHRNKNYLTSFDFLKNNKEYKEKFLNIVENSSNFYQILPSEKNRGYFFTHSPCHSKYIGKMTKKALREQKNMSMDKNIPYRQQYNFLLTEGSNLKPFHIFGHFSFNELFINKNIIGLDTGCIHGNKLTGMKIKYNYIEYKSVDFLNIQNKNNKDLLSLY